MSDRLRKVEAKGLGRRAFIGGSDARIIMGNDEAALLRLWREKRGEGEPEDLSGNLIVQLGLVTEELSRRWYEANTGNVIADVQRQVRHPTVWWIGATLDGRVEAIGAVFEAKFMLPWYFSEEAAAEKYMAQLQHNMWVVASRSAVLSVITGGGKWVEITTHADPLYQHLIVTAERKFWRRDRRAPSPLRRRAAKASHRGGPDCRHERLELLSGICPSISQHTAGVSGPRAIEARAESALPEYAKEAIAHSRPGRSVRTYLEAHGKRFSGTRSTPRTIQPLTHAIGIYLL
jgi:YqaJ-like viral recombinase domain